MYRKQKTWICILMLLLMIFSFSSCDFANIPGNDSEETTKPIVPPKPVPPPETKEQPLPELIVSRMYIAGRYSNKFFAITNTTDSELALKDYSIAFTPNMGNYNIYALPDTTLAPGATLFCMNGYDEREDWKAQFKNIAGLDSLPSSGPFDSPIEKDTYWKGIKGGYISQQMLIVKDVRLEGRNLSWTVVDYPLKWSKPCAYLRTYDTEAKLDKGWTSYTWDKTEHINAIDTGKAIANAKIKLPQDIAKAPTGCEDYSLTETDPPYPGQTVMADNVALGYPDKVTEEDPKGKENYLISKNSYVISYNDTKHTPNWVAWHLTGKDMGSFPRVENYHPDPQLPTEWPKITNEEYKGIAPYNRGHMCPNGERDGNRIMQNDTFSTANMIPQHVENNGGPWGDLEDELRSVASCGKELFIVSGGSGSLGPLKAGSAEVVPTIDVPAYTWKVALAIKNDGKSGTDLARINNGEDVTVYAVWMPNDGTCKANKNNYRAYNTTIDYIEDQTGLDFFPDIKDELENAIEARKGI